jgi:outer membrane protein OmpA-like peptidoglycan-associated protein
MMVDAGFPPAQLQAVGLAGAHPKVPNRDKDGNAIARNQATNQRVVVRLSRLQ